ncbi:MAG TPA: glycosyltransferase [Burkholderiaceae bacterium]
MTPTFSIVINTLNRAPLLQRTLESLRWLKYRGEFEVIVINGPSTDNSGQVIALWLPRIRTGSCDVANLSVSRNIGICMAQGDIVAFIDDDAIPEPEWLSQLAAAYERPEIAAAGGFVFDHTGYGYQYRYASADRLGNANWSATQSAEQFCFPGSFSFPYLQGTNASFRRRVLLEVGGFDEEFDYYLDETDLCCRIVDAGYVIKQLPQAFVHHSSAPSTIRDDRKITRNRYPIIKNKIYFSLKHGRQYVPLAAIDADNRAFSHDQEATVAWHIARGALDPAERQLFRAESESGWERGTARGLSDRRDLIDAEKLKRWRGQFRRFGSLRPLHVNDVKSVVLISRDYPPDHSGGIATFTKALAEALAAQGDLVHVITQGATGNRVIFEHGVWVHYVPVRHMERSPQALARNIPRHIWDWSAVALEECERIATHRAIDAVEAPIWDCEGAAFLLHGHWRLVTSLHTPLHFWIESQQQTQAQARSDGNEQWMASFARPMLQLERELMMDAGAVRANSRAITQEIEQAYGFTFDRAKLRLIPHGMAPLAIESATASARKRNAGVEVLFVGRFEARKGIDVLLHVIPLVLQALPHVVFRLIGDDTIAGPGGATFKEEFLARQAQQEWLGRVAFCGRVSDEALQQAYAACDIFVAPSRFESFGLVLLEAMRAGKPVICCAAGGMPEVVAHGVNGLVIEAGSAAALAHAITTLAGNPLQRAEMGDAGKRVFDEKFTAARMAQASTVLYSPAAVPVPAPAKADPVERLRQCH